MTSKPDASYLAIKGAPLYSAIRPGYTINAVMDAILENAKLREILSKMVAHYEAVYRGSADSYPGYKEAKEILKGGEDDQ